MRTAIVLTNYKRPWNMAPMIEQCLASVRRPEIYLVDNAENAENAEAALDSHAFPFDRVTCLRSGDNLGPGYRFEIVAALPHDVVGCIDDDLILTAAQIDALFRQFEIEPQRLHGVWGERFHRNGRDIVAKRGIRGVEAEVDVLNRAYFLSPSQARVGSRLAASVGYPRWRDVRVGSDIIASYAALMAPMCHDVGPLRDCPTSNDPSIAVWRQSGFYEQRAAILASLMARDRPGSPGE